MARYNSEDDLEIYFEDLSKEAQNFLLDMYGISKPEDLNWDTVPIAIIPKPEVPSYA